MALSLIGAGFGRTGTMSLKLALEYLGLGPCYHMRELLARPGVARGDARQGISRQTLVANESQRIK